MSTPNGWIAPDTLEVLPNEIRYLPVDCSQALNPSETVAAPVSVVITDNANGAVNPTAVMTTPTLAGNVVTFKIWTARMYAGHNYTVTLTFNTNLARTVVVLQTLQVNLF